ncbi:putative malonyl-CoA ACP transacylase, ACP-binding protein [Helianthus debilis subsp. tardiflorus]
MVSIIGLDSDKVQQLCDAANEEVEEAEKVQIANFLCTGNYAVSGGVKGIEVVEAKAKSFKARTTVYNLPHARKKMTVGLWQHKGHI